MRDDADAMTSLNEKDKGMRFQINSLLSFYIQDQYTLLSPRKTSHPTKKTRTIQMNAIYLVAITSVELSACDDDDNDERVSLLPDLSQCRRR